MSVNIVVLGLGGVGKSALTFQFIQRIFVTRYDPTIEESYRKLVEVDGIPMLLEILDTAALGGSYTAMTDLQMKNGEGFILVYSIVSQATYKHIRFMWEQIVRVKDCEDFPAVVVGNKCDLANRVVSAEQGEELAARCNARFVEASAKTGMNVEEVFQTLCRLIIAAGWVPTFQPKRRKEGGGCTLL